MNQSKEIMLKLSEFVKDMVKDALQTLMREERLIYLEEHPAKANAFYTRSLATKFGTIEDLSVPRVREGSFRPSCLPPYRRIEEHPWIWRRLSSPCTQENLVQEISQNSWRTYAGLAHLLLE